MKRSAVLVAMALTACNPNKTALDANFHPTERNWGSREPVWRDEFDQGVVPHPSKWVVASYCGGANQEKQCYRPQNIAVGGGVLTITALYESCSGDDFLTAVGNDEVGQVGCPGPGPNPMAFSSGRLHTRVPAAPNAWKYGRIEVRAKLPYGTATWPAFWMMPLSDRMMPPSVTTYGWPQSGEIDIMEAVNLHSPNDSPDGVESNIHLCRLPGSYTLKQQPNSGCPQLSSAFPTSNYQQVHYPKKLLLFPDSDGCWPDLSRDFHTYALEWSDLQMRFYLDDQLIHTINHVPDSNNVAPFQRPFYLIINLAVGGVMTGVNPVPTPPTDWLDSSTLPKAELILDWVRVYECVPDATAKNCMYQGQGLGRKPPAIGSIVTCILDDPEEASRKDAVRPWPRGAPKGSALSTREMGPSR